MKKAVRNTFKIISYPLLYLGLQFVVSFIYIFSVAVYYMVNTAIESETSGLRPSQDFNFMLEELASKFNILILPLIFTCIITFIIMFAVLRKEWKAEKFWNIKHTGISLILQCIVLGAALNIVTTGILIFIPVSEQSKSLDYLLGDNLTLQILSIALMGPFIEELIFRGVVLKRLTKMMRLTGAVILQAVIFGFVHLNLLQGIYAGLLGIAIGLIYIWYDSVWAAISVHAAYNLTSVLITYFAGNSEIDILILLSASGAALLISLAIFAMLVRKKPNIEINISDNFYNSNNLDSFNNFNRWAY